MDTAREAANLRFRDPVFNAHFSFAILQNNLLPNNLAFLAPGKSLKTRAAEEYLSVMCFCPDVKIEMNDTDQEFKLTFDTFVVKLNLFEVKDVVYDSNESNIKFKTIEDIAASYCEVTPLCEIAMEFFSVKHN